MFVCGQPSRLVSSTEGYCGALIKIDKEAPENDRSTEGLCGSHEDGFGAPILINVEH